jgi:hypothetical protein
MTEVKRSILPPPVASLDDTSPDGVEAEVAAPAATEAAPPSLAPASRLLPPASSALAAGLDPPSTIKRPAICLTDVTADEDSNAQHLAIAGLLGPLGWGLDFTHTPSATTGEPQAGVADSFLADSTSLALHLFAGPNIHLGLMATETPELFGYTPGWRRPTPAPATTLGASLDIGGSLLSGDLPGGWHASVEGQLDASLVAPLLSTPLEGLPIDMAAAFGMTDIDGQVTTTLRKEGLDLFGSDVAISLGITNYADIFGNLVRYALGAKEHADQHFAKGETASGLADLCPRIDSFFDASLTGKASGLDWRLAAHVPLYEPFSNRLPTAYLAGELAPKAAFVPDLSLRLGMSGFGVGLSKDVTVAPNATLSSSLRLDSTWDGKVNVSAAASISIKLGPEAATQARPSRDPALGERAAISSSMSARGTAPSPTALTESERGWLKDLKARCWPQGIPSYGESADVRARKLAAFKPPTDEERRWIEANILTTPERLTAFYDAIWTYDSDRLYRFTFVKFFEEAGSDPLQAALAYDRSSHSIDSDWSSLFGVCVDYSVFWCHYLEKMGYEAEAIAYAAPGNWGHAVTAYKDKNGTWTILDNGRFYTTDKRELAQALRDVVPEALVYLQYSKEANDMIPMVDRKIESGTVQELLRTVRPPAQWWERWGKLMAPEWKR